MFLLTDIGENDGSPADMGPFFEGESVKKYGVRHRQFFLLTSLMVVKKTALPYVQAMPFQVTNAITN